MPSIRQKWRKFLTIQRSGEIASRKERECSTVELPVPLVEEQEWESYKQSKCLFLYFYCFVWLNSFYFKHLHLHELINTPSLAPWVEGKYFDDLGMINNDYISLLDQMDYKISLHKLNAESLRESTMNVKSRIWKSNVPRILVPQAAKWMTNLTKLLRAYKVQ